jgi:hypothetical protein
VTLIPWALDVVWRHYVVDPLAEAKLAGAAPRVGVPLARALELEQLHAIEATS